jgi:hypothetical protein
LLSDLWFGLWAGVWGSSSRKNDAFFLTNQWYQSPIGSLESQMSEIFEQRQNVAQRNGELKLMTKTLTTEQLVLLIG